MARHIHNAGLNLIKSFESLRLESYDDGVGTWTIGYGHTAGVKKGDRITRSEADTLLRADLFDAEQAVERLVKVEIDANHFAALVSLVFNIGATAFSRSSVLRHVNSKRFMKAADAFLLWNKATVKGKKVELKGLTRRRHAERALFLSNQPDISNDVDSATPTPAELPTESPNLVQSGTVSPVDGPPAQATVAATIPAVPPLPTEVPSGLSRFFKWVGGLSIGSYVGSLAVFKDHPELLGPLLALLKIVFVGLSGVGAVVAVMFFIERIAKARQSNELNQTRLTTFADPALVNVDLKGWKSPQGEVKQ